MLLAPYKSRRPSRSPQESPRAQLQNELPSRYMYESVHSSRTAMPVEGTGKSGDDRINILELARQSAVTPNYQRGLGGLPQHSPQRPSRRH